MTNPCGVCGAPDAFAFVHGATRRLVRRCRECMWNGDVREVVPGRAHGPETCSCCGEAGHPASGCRWQSWRGPVVVEDEDEGRDAPNPELKGDAC